MLRLRRSIIAPRRTINQWVGKKTQGKIVNLLPPGAVDGQTTLVLANAIYFQGSWARPFYTALTKDMPFKMDAASEATVPMMNQTEGFAFARIPEASILVLPYARHPFQMIVVLPDSIDGLASIEARFVTGELEGWLAGATGQTVRVYLPRFRLEGSYLLGPALQELGLRTAFSSTEADFSGMNGQRGLYVSVVSHKAWIDVDERGTKAAAATALSMTASSHAERTPPPTFRADHPFLFLIREMGTGAILFVGRVVDPAPAGPSASRTP